MEGQGSESPAAGSANGAGLDLVPLGPCVGRVPAPPRDARGFPVDRLPTRGRLVSVRLSPVLSTERVARVKGERQ
jgi:hypothetical protein